MRSRVVETVEASRERRVTSNRWTEQRMLDLLRRRYTAVRAGTNADRYVRAAHVPTAAERWRGGVRVADYLVLDTYGAGQLHGFEVKVSRSDWLAELRDPGKSETWRCYCDRWWLVVPDRAVVADDLPAGWGLLTPSIRTYQQSTYLRAARAAPALSREPMPPSVLAQWARCIATTARYEGNHP